MFNQIVKNNISIDAVRWFMTCYFNDTIGGITFVAYCNVVFNFYDKELLKLWQIELLMFSCGVFWEYLTPLFRENTVSDIWDILAYMIGGFIYWAIARKK